MSMIALLAAASLQLTTPSLSLSPDMPSHPLLHLAQDQMFEGGNFMRTAEGCTYRRTQAPGYAARWILVHNPSHIGLPNSPRSCAGML